MPTSLRHEAATSDHRFLRALTAPGREPIPAEGVAVVIAHPDDETIGCGALLGRLDGVTVILVTDGAPRKSTNVNAYGFASAADYASARLTEIRAALAIAGVGECALIALNVADQEAALNLTSLTRRLAAICAERNISVLLTHAYEGGHPDHDATAFAAHAAMRLSLRREGLVMEMPFYRIEGGKWVYQQFRIEPKRGGIAIPLNPNERARKRRMLDAHRTQEAILSPFPLDVERFRVAPDYDFSQLPNGGELLYEAYDWGIDGKRWQALACSALSELGLRGAA